MPQDRHHRQSLLPDFGPASSDTLRAAHAAIVGCGALGSSVIDHLARAGVGTLTILDRDTVELTNLQRQTLYTMHDLGVPKVEAARRRVEAIDPSVKVHARAVDLRPEDAEDVLGLHSDRTVPPIAALSGRSMDAGKHQPPHATVGGTVLIDCTDNFETRYLLNDLAVKHSIPLIYGGVIATRGMAMTILPGESACLRCAFEDAPEPGSQPTCDTAGVLGPVAAIVAAVQATEALKILVGRRDKCSRTLLDMDPWQGQRRRLDLARRDDCPCCGQRRFEFLAGRSTDAALCGQDAVQVHSAPGTRLDLVAMQERLAPHGAFTRLGTMMLKGTLRHEAGDGGEPIHVSIFADGRTIVRGFSGSTAIVRARTVVARYIGA